MKKSKPDKFIGFFKLMDVMKLPGCPVCRRIIDDTHRAMDGFLYEKVNDPELRLTIRNDRGLCHRHSWQLAMFGDALGGAILFRDVLEAVIPEVGNHRLFASRKTSTAHLGEQVCMFCHAEQQLHDSMITEIANHIEDPELHSAWAGPAMLCIRHLTEVAAQVSDPIQRDILIEAHREIFLELCKQLKDSIAKQSHDRRNEAPGAEKNSWLRAIEALVGRPGVR